MYKIEVGGRKKKSKVEEVNQTISFILKFLLVEMVLKTAKRIKRSRSEEENPNRRKSE